MTERWSKRMVASRSSAAAFGGCDPCVNKAESLHVRLRGVHNCARRAELGRSLCVMSVSRVYTSQTVYMCGCTAVGEELK